MKTKKLICIVLSLLCLLPLFSRAAFAQKSDDDDKIIPTDYEIPEDENMSVDSRYALLYSEYDKRFLYSRRADELVEPASTTKIMVGVMIFEKFADRLDTEVTITKKLTEGKRGFPFILKTTRF